MSALDELMRVKKLSHFHDDLLKGKEIGEKRMKVKDK